MAELDFQPSIKDSQEKYVFTVKAKAGFEIRDVKVYRTEEYAEGQTDSSAEPFDMDSEELEDGTVTYTIAENTIQSDIVIVVMAEAAAGSNADGGKEAETGEDCGGEEEAQAAVTITYSNSEARSVRMMYAVGDSSRYRVCPSNGITVPKGQKLRLKASTIRSGNIILLKDTPADGTDVIDTELLNKEEIYEIESVQGDRTIEISLEKRTYKVYEKDTNAKDIVIRYTKGMDRNPPEEIENVKVWALANSALGFSIRPNQDADNKFNSYTRRVSRVAYQIGDGEPVDFKVTSTIQKGSGSFTVPAAAITGDVTIIVETEDIPSHKVTFEFDESRVKIQATLRNGGKPAQTGEIGKADEAGSNVIGNPVSIIEGTANQIQFNPQLNADKGAKFKITGVTLNDGSEPSKGEESGNYIIRNVKEDTTVRVSISLDENKCNNLTLEADGHNDAFTVGVTGFADGDDDEGKDMSYEAGDRILTQSDMLRANIRVEEGYRIEKVTLSDSSKEDELTAAQDGEYVYDIPFGAGGTEKKTLKVYTVPERLENGKKVTFTSDSSFGRDLSDDNLQVTLSDLVVKNTENKNTYEIQQNATYFEFKVTTDDSKYEPVISYQGKTDGEVSTLSYRSREGNTYTYSMAANRLADNAQITVGKEAVAKRVRIACNADEVKIVSAVSEGDVVAGMEEAGGVSYQIPRGKEVTFRVEALDNCEILSAETVVGSAVAKKESTGASGFTFSVEVLEDAETVIISRGLYRVNPLKESGVEMTPVGGVYQVTVGNDYTMGAVYGVKTPANYDYIRINGTIVDSDDFEQLESIGVDQLLEGRTDADISFMDKAAGKQFTVDLCLEDDEKDITIASYKMKVSKPAVLSAIKVQGINNKATVSQVLDTVKEYPVIPAPAAVDISELRLDNSNPDAVEAELTDNNKLLKMTSLTEADQEAEIRLYMYDDSEEGQKTYFTCTVKTVKQLNGKAKPSVTLKSASDNTLNLTVKEPGGVEMPSAGKLYYKVEAVPKKMVDGEACPAEAVGAKLYVEKTAEASQDVQLPVINKDDGEGLAWEFDVTVTLIQTSGEMEEDGSNEEEVLVDAGISFTTGGKPFATRSPYYEDNLKLKKGTTTLYTGQSAVIATPQFGKYTSFIKNVELEDITPGLEEEEKLSLNWNRSSGSVEAKAETGKASLGKHTIEVRAEAPAQTYASRASLAVTVVRGIEELEVTIPGNTLYKANNKAASLKAVAVYNNGKTGREAPKAKKVVWSIVSGKWDAGLNEGKGGYAPLEPGDALYKQVTVKNGTVTVNKNYATAGDTFVIMAEAADYKGSVVKAYSDPVTITSKGMTIGGAALVKENADGKITIVAADKDTVKASEAAGARLIAFSNTLSVKKGDVFTKEALGMWEQNIVYASGSAKSVSVAADGGITVIKPANKVKLSVSAGDGSLAKKTITVTVAYDATGETLGLEMAKYDEVDEKYSLHSGPEEENPEFRDSTGARFRLTVKQLTVRNCRKIIA